MLRLRLGSHPALLDMAKVRRNEYPRTTYTQETARVATPSRSNLDVGQTLLERHWDIDASALFSVLNAYEKENATCISDVLREITNGRYVPAVRTMEKFLLFVEVLFAATDDLEYQFALLNATGESDSLNDVRIF